MATKKTKQNVDPGRPVSRPMAPVSKDAGWGKTLTKAELLGIIDRIYAKQEEKKDMSKFSDTIKAALDKKKGITHLENDGVVVEKKEKVKTAPTTGKKPPTRSAGRGR